MGVVILNFQEFAHRGGAFGLGFDGVEVGPQPELEIPGFPRIGKNEQRGSLHGFSRHRGGDASGLPDDLHAPVVAGQHGAFDGSHGHIKLAPGVLAVDQQWPGHPYRNLRHAPEIFNVPRHHMGIIGVLLGMVQFNAGLGFDERLPLGENVVAVVILGGAGDLWTVVAHQPITRAFAALYSLISLAT